MYKLSLKTFGEKNKTKYKIERVEDGKVYVLVKYPSDVSVRGGKFDLEQFKKFLYLPELF